ARVRPRIPSRTRRPRTPANMGYSMKHSIRIARAATLALAISAALATLPAGAQVTSGAVEVRAFAATSATNLYAAGYGSGLFTSTNAGTSWARTGLPNNMRYLTSVVAVSSGTITSGLVLVGGDEGLMRSAAGTSGPFSKVLE